MPKPTTPKVTDVNGAPLEKGDTVATIGGGITAKVHDVNIDMDTAFVFLRPMHQPFAKGVWHASDRVLRLSGGPRPKDSNANSSNKSAQPKAGKRAGSTAGAKRRSR
ncbi:MAG: hypothetical protein GC164_07780 [Phycisphaera sp.]|nr:hypothetical protein [Phycisphaera sp.]